MAFTLPSAAHHSPERHRRRAIAVAIAAALVLIATCFSHRWFTPRASASDELRQEMPGEAPRLDEGFGLVSYERCYAGSCERRWNKEVIDQMNGVATQARASTMFAAFGIVTFGCLVFAIGGLLAAAVLAIAGKRLRPPVAPTAVALIGLVITALTALGMVATRPGIPIMEGLEIAFDAGWAFWFYVGGTIAGIAAALMLDRHLRRDDDDIDLPRARQIIRAR